MSSEQILLGLGLIIGLGILLQWIAKMLKIPGIILLLPAGILVGPVLGLVNPNEIFGNSLFPLVTIGVGILLLKGGFELNVRKLQSDTKQTVWRLVTIGVLITLAIGLVASFLIFNIPFYFALLLGAILVVSGPTVVGPILNIARPKQPVGHILLWEGITIDPIGASLSVAVLSIATSQNPYPFIDLFLTLGVGVAIGIIAAVLYIVSERSGRVPPNLSALVAFMFGIMAIVGAEMIFSEAGLFAAVTMGFILGNQRLTPATGIRTLTETIEPLIIGILFIMLAALVSLPALADYMLPALVLVAIYVLVARPLVAFVTTHGLGFSRSQRIFIGAMAPRGIVAAATSSLFAINLTNIGINFPQLVPVVFTVIIGTVAIYGLSAPIISRKLNLSQPGRTAVAVVGDQPWVVDLAEALQQAGARVMFIAPGEENLQKRAADGKLAYMVYTGSFAELSDDEILDEAHELKNQVKWLIITTSDHDRIKIATETFLSDIGNNSIIIFGRSRARQDEAVFGTRRSDILANTPFGLFGRNEDELLDLLDAGGSFEVLESTEQPQEGVPVGKKAFLRVRSDGTLAVPGSEEPLAQGDSLILVAPGSSS